MAGRPLWRGALTFGLVSVPAELAPLEASDAEFGFTMLDKRDQSRIKYHRVNERTGKEVAWNDIVKGYAKPGGGFVLVTPEDLKKAAPKATRTIEITDFVKKDSIPPWYFEKPYLLQPAEEGQKAYAVLVAALRNSNLVGIATLVLHSRQHLAAIVPDGSALVVVAMRYARELRRTPSMAAGDVKVAKQEVDLAKLLIERMTSDWAPAKYHDEYRDKLRQWLDRRAKSGGKAAEAQEPPEEEPAGPFNIMDQLRKSIEGSRRESSRGSTGHRSKPKPARRRKAG